MWCPGQFYADFPKGNQILQSKIGQYGAPSCYHGSVGHGWEVVGRYISGQKGYEKADTVLVMDEEKAKTHKTWYTSLYNKLFGGEHQKIEKLLYCCDIPVMIMQFKSSAVVLKYRPCT